MSTKIRTSPDFLGTTTMGLIQGVGPLTFSMMSKLSSFSSSFSTSPLTWKGILWCSYFLGVTSGSTCNFTTLFRVFPLPPNTHLNSPCKTSGLLLFIAVTVAVLTDIVTTLSFPIDLYFTHRWLLVVDVIYCIHVLIFFFGWVTRFHMSHCSRFSPGFWSANVSEMTNFSTCIVRFPSIPVRSISSAIFALARFLVALVEVLTIAWPRSPVTWVRGIFVSLAWATATLADFSFDSTNIWWSCGFLHLTCLLFAEFQSSSKF